MPHSASSRIPGQNCLAVASLHSYGGPLAGEGLPSARWLLLF